jgi:hypothetical protein
LQAGDDQLAAVCPRRPRRWRARRASRPSHHRAVVGFGARASWMSAKSSWRTAWAACGDGRVLGASSSGRGSRGPGVLRCRRRLRAIATGALTHRFVGERTAICARRDARNVRAAAHIAHARKCAPGPLVGCAPPTRRSRSAARAR